MKSRKRESKASQKKSDETEGFKQPKKRGRKPKNKNEEEKSKKDKIKEKNKERAQRSRDRKNKYTQLLETKIDILEKQVKYLTLELDKYKRNALKIQIDEAEEKKNIKEEDQSILEGILDNIQSTANINSFTKAHANIIAKEGFTGENRIKTLDKAFNVILDYLVPDTFWMAFYTMNQLNDAPYYVDMEKIKKIRNYSKYQFQVAYDNGEINDSDRYWHAIKVTDEQGKKLGFFVFKIYSFWHKNNSKLHLF